MEELRELNLEDLKEVTWDYSSMEVEGIFEGKVIRNYLFDAKRCKIEVNPLQIQRCNVRESWVEFLVLEPSISLDEKDFLGALSEHKVKRDENGDIARERVNCEVEVDVLDSKGNIIVTLR